MKTVPRIFNSKSIFNNRDTSEIQLTDNYALVRLIE
jgi:hypothetical protein